MAKSSEQETDMFLAVKQVVNNCCVDPEFDVNKIALFDLEYLFLKIRASSVSDNIEVSYRDFEDEKIYEFEVDLNKVVVKFPENIDNTIKIDKKSGLTMKYPRASLFEDKEFINSKEDSLFELTARCIDKIYSDDEMIDAASYTPKELGEFLESLDLKSFEKIREFVVNQPALYYELNYKNDLGHDRKIELKTLTDFFTLR
jgi:hypothetical protein